MNQDKNFIQNFVLFSIVLSIFIAGVIYDTFYIPDQSVATATPLPMPPATKDILPTKDIHPTEVILPTNSSNFESLDLQTTDGLKLYARYYPPSDPQSAPGTLLLLHGAYQDTRRWFGFIEAAALQNFAVLSIDLRGHGKSEGGQVFDSEMDQDVEAAIGWLKQTRGLPMDQITIVGESLGSSLGLRAGARHPDLGVVVMLSPGMQLWDIGIQEAFDLYGPRPLLLVAAEQDGYPANTVSALQERSVGNLTVELLPGAAHGTDLFSANPELVPTVLGWVQEALGKP